MSNCHLCSLTKRLVKDHFKDSFDAVFEHLANGGAGGKVRNRRLSARNMEPNSVFLGDKDKLSKF